MIPHSSAGVQPWAYPVHAVNGGTGLVDVAQTVDHFDTPLERLSSSQLQPKPSAVIELAEDGSEMREGEPPPKRPRLDAGVTGLVVWDPKNTPVSANSCRSSVPSHTQPRSSFEAQVSDIPGLRLHGEDTVTAGQSDETASLPPLPTPPWKHSPQDSVEGSSGRLREGSPPKEVPTIPFRIQIPDAAPVLKGKSELSCIMSRNNHLTWRGFRIWGFRTLDRQPSGGCPQRTGCEAGTL